MNENKKLNPELQALFSELLDGDLSEHQAQSLCEILRGAPDAQEAYQEFMSLHALLHLDFGHGQLYLPPVIQSPEARIGEAAATQSIHIDDRTKTRLWPTSRHFWTRARLTAIFLASAACIAAVALGLLTQMRGGRGSGGDPTAESQLRAISGSAEEKGFSERDIPAVAVLGQASRANWSDSRIPVTIGSQLRPGKFQLLDGLVQIEFFSGASVIIQGPAEFDLISPSRLMCQLGKIRAHVPSQAKGFTITTPMYAAVDLGTEFTVKVEQTGESQFQVLDGEVQLWDGRHDPSVLAEQLIAGEGARSTATGELVPIAGEESGFIGGKEMLEMATAAMQERYEIWRRFSRTIRSNPNVILYYGFDGHEPWDRVLQNEKPNADKMLNGAIVGCQWTTGRWNRKKALEFKRTSDRVRLSVPGEYESLTIAAWLRVEGLERWLSSLMLTDGHEPGEVHWQMTDMGQLMLGVKAEPERSHDYYSPSVIGPRDLGRWVHLACVYNGSDGYVSHFLDGKEVSRESVRVKTTLRIGAAEIGNWVPKDLLDYRIRSLNGRVDEFILFDAPLSADEIHSIYESGRPQS
jgi:hypothetical protein